MKLDLNTTKTLAELLAVGDRLERAPSVLEDIGERMVNFSIPENFAQGGRPKWPANKRGTKTGTDTGELASSVTASVSGLKLEVGTNLKRARQFHKGGDITPKRARALAIPVSDKARRRRPKDFPDLFMVKPTDKTDPNQRGLLAREVGKDQVEVMFVLRGRVKQPPRPFLLWHPTDVAYAQSALRALVETG